MRVVVDVDRCDSNGLCASFAPDVFRLDDDDELHVIDARPAEQLWNSVAEAARGCPKLAISIVDET